VIPIVKRGVIDPADICLYSRSGFLLTATSSRGYVCIYTRLPGLSSVYTLEERRPCGIFNERLDKQLKTAKIVVYATIESGTVAEQTTAGILRWGTTQR
jgi:hypothetical protein